jgi:hypothetical protein
MEESEGRSPLEQAAALVSTGLTLLTQLPFLADVIPPGGVCMCARFARRCRCMHVRCVKGSGGCMHVRVRQSMDGGLERGYVHACMHACMRIFMIFRERVAFLTPRPPAPQLSTTQPPAFAFVLATHPPWSSAPAADTLAWKLTVLAEGCEWLLPRLSRVQQRTLVLVGDGDLLIPSGEEGRRLERVLPRAVLRVSDSGGHGLLQEGGIDLVSIVEEEGFYLKQKRMSSPAKRRGGAGFGSPAPVELPSQQELRRWAGGGGGVRTRPLPA